MALAACSGSEVPVVAKTAARLPAQVLDKVDTGLQIATLPRPTPGVVRLALFIDAGSRDASPPQTAALAAWVAAANGGNGTEATVYPDVTELARDCPAKALAHCSQELANALATREPSASALTRARTRLRDAQRLALARDPVQRAEQLALRALLGTAADGFLALGAPSDVATSAGNAVPKFLRDHYGPGRALLVAAGDVEPEQMRDTVTQSFAHLRRAALPRAQRKLEPTPEPRLELAFDDRTALSVALAASDQSELISYIEALSSAVSRGPARLTGHVFAARGGALALLRLHGEDPELALERITRELARLQLEKPVAATQPQPASDDLDSSVRRFGLQFGARGKSSIASLQFGVGLLLDGGPGAGPRAQTAASELEKGRSGRLTASFERALSQSQPHTRGELEDYGASVVTDNGAHVDVQFAQAPDVAIAVRVALGAEQDPTLLHGQSALIATLTSLACASMGPQLLRTRLAQLGATLEPRVDPESYGILMRAPQEHWQQALELALRCVRAPSREPTHLADAAVTLQTQLRKQSNALALRAQAALLIAPRAPGQYAPWGDPTRLGAVTARDLESALQQTQYASRWSVGIAGRVPVQEAVDRAARQLIDLPTGALLKAAAPGDLAAELRREIPRSTDPNGTNVLVVWTVRGKFQQRLGARVFARSMATLLGALPGIDARWHEGDLWADTAFAAVVLRMRPDLTAGLPELLRSATQTLDDRWLDRALGPAVESARDARHAAEAQLSVRIEHAVRARFGVPNAEPSLEDTKRLLQALRDAPARWAAAHSVVNVE